MPLEEADVRRILAETSHEEEQNRKIASLEQRMDAVERPLAKKAAEAMQEWGWKGVTLFAIVSIVLVVALLFAALWWGGWLHSPSQQGPAPVSSTEKSEADKALDELRQRNQTGKGG